MNYRADPAQFFTRERFDVAAKLLYADFYLKNYNSDWGKEVYASHLKVWNNYLESNEPEKNSLDKFINRFNYIIDTMKSNGYNHEFPVWVDEGNNLINGSHRLAAALYLKQDISYKISTWGGQSGCAYTYFKDKSDFVEGGLQTKYMDAMAVEFCKYNNNSFLLFAFPSSLKSVELLESTIKKYGRIIYEKKIELNRTGAFNAIWHLYYGEPWAGSIENGLSGVKEKLDLCYSGEDFLSKVYLIEILDDDKLESVKQLKKEARGFFNIGNHSLHINDTHEQAIFLSRMFFNDNSIWALNNYKYNVQMNNFNSLFNILRNSDVDKINFCISSSALLGFLGIRDVNDFDYISYQNQEIFNKDVNIKNHLSEEKYYSKNFDDIIYNPSHHFWFNGVKFSNSNILIDMKNNRKEPKDLVDVNSILEYLNA